MIIYRLLSHSKLKQLRSTKKEIIYPKIGKHTKSNITQFPVKMSPHMYEVVKMPATANTTVLFATTKNQVIAFARLFTYKQEHSWQQLVLW